MKTKLSVKFLSLSITLMRKCLLVISIFSFLMQLSCSKDDTFETTGIATSDNAVNLGTTTGTTYYVSMNGNDSNDGLTESTPWKSLGYAETHATSPGDIIALKKGDTFTITLAARLIITQTGTSGSPITWDGGLWGTGSNATIKGSGFYDGIPLWDIPNSHYLTIQNLIFQGESNNGSAIIVGGYWSSSQEGATNDIVIQDCSFYNIGNSSGESVYAILVSCYDYDYNNITIKRNYVNTVGQCGIGIYNGRTQLGAKPSQVSNVYIGYNEVYNYSLNSTGEAYLINNKVTGCIFEHNISIYGPGDNAGFGLVIGSGEPTNGYYPTGIVVRYNEIRTKNEPALFLQSGGAFGVSIYYNLFYRNAHDASISSGIVATMADVRSFNGSTLNLFNNTIVANHASTYCMGDISGSTNIWHIKNNIFYNKATTTVPLLYLYTSQSDHSNNCFHSVGATGSTTYVQNGGSTYTKTTVTSWEAKAKSTDPLMTDVAGFNWELQEGSPDINEGVSVSLTNDYAGNSIVGLPDIGAYEYASLADPVIPVYVSSAIANASPSLLELTYNSTLANIVPATSTFTVMVNSAARTVNSVSISGTKVLLTLASPVVYGNIVTVSYTKPTANPLQTSTGGQAASITAQSVINNCTPTSNQPPIVRISSPVNRKLFRAPATITITAIASDIDGTISKVEFYNGSIKLGETTTSPYSFVWKYVPRGIYSITATATDNLNSKTISTPVSVSVWKRTY